MVEKTNDVAFVALNVLHVLDEHPDRRRAIRLRFRRDKPELQSSRVARPQRFGLDQGKLHKRDKGFAAGEASVDAGTDAAEFQKIA